MAKRPFRLAAVVLGAWCAACVGDPTAPAARLAVSPAGRALSVRADSLGPLADSALVTIGGADAATARWTVSHDSAPWLVLLTGSGSGPGWLRWRVDTAALGYDTLPGVWMDTLTVTLQTPDAAQERIAVSLTVRSGPPQFLAVRRAWRPGERDSVIAAILAERAWGAFSDIAAQVLPAWDSTTDVVPNPAWRSPAGAARGAGPAAAPRAALYASGWSMVGMQIRIVFDSIPTDTTTRDSLQWMETLWWNPLDAGSHGFIVNAPDTLLTGFRTVKTSTFDANGGHNGLATGEFHKSTLTYWEGSGGGWKVPLNSYSGAWDTITSGPYKGGDIQAVGQMGGNMQNIKMPRVSGTELPATQTFSVDYTLAPISSTRIRCYFPPVTPPAGFHPCVGSAPAAIVAAARAGRLTRAQLAGFGAAAPPAAAAAGVLRRAAPGPLLAQSNVTPSGGTP